LIIRQIVKFLGVGVAATLTHVTVALIAEGVVELPALFANFLGFSVAVFVSYFGHTIFTFQVKKNHSVYLPKFIVVALLGLCVSSLITYVVTSRLGIRFEWAMLLVTFCVPAVTFTASKFWAFAEQNEK